MGVGEAMPLPYPLYNPPNLPNINKVPINPLNTNKMAGSPSQYKQGIPNFYIIILISTIFV
jgi:hypothetical protein